MQQTGRVPLGTESAFHQAKLASDLPLVTGHRVFREQTAIRVKVQLSEFNPNRSTDTL